MTCPATLGALVCTRADAHAPHHGCVYVAASDDLGTGGRHSEGVHS